MIIRPATKFDLPYYLKTVHEIHEKGDIGLFDVKLNDEYLNKLFATVLAGAGTAFVAESDNTIGIILGLISPNIWAEESLLMNQLLLYVDEDYRNTRAGYLLLQNYKDKCIELKEQGRIHYYTINAAKSMFEIDFTRFGYEMIATTWINTGD